MRILITGISGFVGHRLVRQLRQGGDEAVGTYVGVRPELGAIELHELDLAAVEPMRKLIERVAPERIIHLAALSHVGASWERMGDYFRVNVLGTENLMSAAGGVPVLVASSAEVYGQVPEDEQPIDEGRLPRPASPYAMTKAAAERLALGCRATVVRMFNLVGPGQASTFAMPSFAHQLAEIAGGRHEPILAVGNLEARRDFTHIDDAVEGLLLLARSGEPGGIYNLGSGTARSIREMLDLLVEVSGVEARVKIDQERVRPVDLPLLQADAGRLQALGWSERRGARQALEDLWDTVRGEPGELADRGGEQTMVDDRTQHDGDLPSDDLAKGDLPSGDLPSTGLLSFYDRLRHRMRAFCERRAGRLGAVGAETLLLVPDIFILLVRLSLDKEVPKQYRTLIASTLAYFVLPFDLFPEGLVGPLGYMDDLMLASGVLATAFGGDLAIYASRHWSGGGDLLEVLADVSATARAFLGDSTSARVQGTLARFGVVLEDESDEPAPGPSRPRAVPDPTDRSAEPFSPSGPRA